jgi:hypothetical protein
MTLLAGGDLSAPNDYASGIRQTRLSGVPYGLFMPLSLSPPPMAVQLRNIRDVADDLSRELIRVQCPPSSAIHEMTAFIKAEAEAALTALKNPQR